MAKVMLLVPYASYFKNFQGDLLHRLTELGHEVIAVAPDDKCGERIYGVNYMMTPIANTGTNPFYDIHCMYKLARLLKREKPDILCCYSLKPNLYGSIAAKLTGVSETYLFITGLGYLYSVRTIKQRLLYPIISKLYGVAVKQCTGIFFENRDDAALFAKRYVPSKQKSRLVNGVGVNVTQFQPPAARRQEQMKFLLVARMLKEKGVQEYADAARLLKRKYPWAAFQLLGPFDRNPSAIREGQIQSWTKEGVIDYLGVASDVRPYLHQATVFVLPSYYREGIPKSILEAMACGLPIVTTNMPGCRETVREGKNGILVPPRDAEALAHAMELFLLDSKLAGMMGSASRQLAVKEFHVDRVNAAIVNGIGLGGGG
ncbi:glycosyltransferase family 4 protein [Paenibacillus sp. J5C_2022]|uniref:glycosyltransferase family 4 protein n=1 Tax=Paenibacillus sp. J5C2022 TaxID=2977129 RepID=UPI0021D392CD|nr:glycosyltransferase family 4 protein [Paenibacillus sp. J5C2022]MCU6709584.1 glycosyltransferase family 4 protein [Paenibacillus sp. J5C2022]